MSSGIVKSPINYKIEVKRCLVDALRNEFDEHESLTMRSTKFTMEYPMTPEQYPCVIVGFRERLLQDAGVGHRENDGPYAYHRMKFEGDVSLEVFATTSLDRDYISDWLVSLMSFRWNQNVNYLADMLFSSEVEMQPALGNIIPSGESTMSGLAWGHADGRIYTCGYSFTVIGSFLSQPLVGRYIERVSGTTIADPTVGGDLGSSENWQTPYGT